MTHYGIHLAERYTFRPVTDLGTFEHAGWRMKITGIAYHGDRPRPELVEATTRAATAILPRPTVTAERYGTGFIGVHDGRGAGFCFVD